MAAVLEGITVLELTRVAPGSYCTMLLGDMGATVVKVETPVGAEGKRPYGSGVSLPAEEAQIGAFNHLNRNKQSIALNLRSEEGQRILQDLARSADVVVEGFRPGAAKRLGADYETLRALNPRLIYCSLSGFGQDGPYKDRPGHDVNYLALGGTLGLLAEPGAAPVIPLNLIADYASASLHGVIGILLAIVARERTGAGQNVDISFLDGVIELTAALPGLWQYFLDGRLPRPGKHWLTGVRPYYACYETKDGKWVTLGCMEPPFWARFCRVIGRDDLVHFQFDPRHSFEAPDEATEAAREELRTVFKTRTRGEWVALLGAEDICFAEVNSWDEVFADPQVRHRQMLLEIDDPAAGKVKQPGIAIKLSETPGSIRSLAPYHGQHTDRLLASLGYSSAAVADLRRRGVVE